MGQMKSMFRSGLCGPSTPTDCPTDSGLESDDDDDESTQEPFLPPMRNASQRSCVIPPAAHCSRNPSQRSQNPSQFGSRNTSQRSRNPSQRSRNPSQRSRNPSLRSKAGSFRKAVAELARSNSRSKTPDTLDVLPALPTKSDVISACDCVPSVNVTAAVVTQLQVDLMPYAVPPQPRRYGFLHRHFRRRRSR